MNTQLNAHETDKEITRIVRQRVGYIERAIDKLRIRLNEVEQQCRRNTMKLADMTKE
jgi:hypothetical protein